MYVAITSKVDRCWPGLGFFKTFSLALMSKKILGRSGRGHFGEVAAYRRVEIYPPRECKGTWLILAKFYTEAKMFAICNDLTRKQ